jgi:hypothetical protein
VINISIHFMIVLNRDTKAGDVVKGKFIGVMSDNMFLA